MEHLTLIFKSGRIDLQEILKSESKQSQLLDSFLNYVPETSTMAESYTPVQELLYDYHLKYIMNQL